MPIMCEIKLQIFMLFQDDPTKCTASRLVKFKLAQRVNFISEKSVLLNPLSKVSLSRKDSALSSSICAIDCSWNHTHGILNSRKTLGHRLARRIPSLLASNPTNYSKIGKLSTAEALAGALYILGDRRTPELIMNKFKWGHTFLELNCNILEDYFNAENELQIAEIEKEYFPLTLKLKYQ
jgi:pre-rRNA-processing protein TSR3